MSQNHRPAASTAHGHARLAELLSPREVSRFDRSTDNDDEHTDSSKHLISSHSTSWSYDGQRNVV